MTPEHESELIDRMVTEIWRLPMDNEHHTRMRAALSIAKPIIRDEALEEVERHFEDAEWASAVARIRALKSKGQKPEAMTDISKLRELLDRVESATGGDAHTNQEIACALGGYSIAREDDYGRKLFLRPGQNPDEAQCDAYLQSWVPDYTSSIDAAVQLCERVLPGWIWDVTSTGTSWIMPPEDIDMHFAAKAAAPALALCAAILRAKIAMLEKSAA